MQVELTEVDSSTNQRKIVLDSLPVMIGQSPDATVRLDDHWVSRQHCEITAVKDTLVVRDLGSILGTFVNGLNVTTAHLMPGDKLTVGITSFTVDYERPNGMPGPRQDRTQTSASSPSLVEREASLPTRADTRPVHLALGEPASEEARWSFRRLLPSVFHRALARVRRKPR